MKTAHIFIVDTNTFKYHLEYLFAGTGAKDTVIDFNGRTETLLHFTTENNLLGMIADSQRIRRGDYVFFYLQQNTSERVYEGKFYGIFKAKEDFSFLDNNDRGQFLKQELQKSLTFRTLIEPIEVYSKGVSEWEALDEIKHIQSPQQMLWSLIYRKLKGNRGNTMITMYESERLAKLISDKNGSQSLEASRFTFDIDTHEIKRGDHNYDYAGRKEEINILPRLINKYNQDKAFESHLQAYIVQNIGRRTNRSLDTCLMRDESELEWLGNEVSCGVGMQRIDVMLSFIAKDIRTIVPIELKAVEASPNNIIQIQRYIDWLEQYYIPNRISDIQPVLIAKKATDKTSSDYQSLIQTFEGFDERNQRCHPLRYIEFEVIDDILRFAIIK